jgi:hypothetical protein
MIEHSDVGRERCHCSSGLLLRTGVRETLHFYTSLRSIWEYYTYMLTASHERTQGPMVAVDFVANDSEVP